MGRGETVGNFNGGSKVLLRNLLVFIEKEWGIVVRRKNFFEESDFFMKRCPV